MPLPSSSLATSTLSAAVRPIKLAIIGGGPSAFYAASRILHHIQPDSHQGQNVQVDMYDRSWAPYGLVRYGVAPDHPEVKNCIHKFDLTAHDPRFRFFGNVAVAQEAPKSSPRSTVAIALRDLFPHYSHLLLAIGSSKPRPLPATMKGTIPAIDVVHWYTGHESNPPPPPLDRTRHVTLIGHGNVSLDIARMLLTPPSVLEKLDIPQHVLDVLRTSIVEHVSIASRRGPAEVSFTAKELRELLNLPNATMLPIVPPEILQPPPQGATRQQSRILELLRKGSVPKGAPASDARKATWSLEFFRSPIETGPKTITYEVTELDADRRAKSTGVRDTHQTDLVITSVGSWSEPFVRNGGTTTTTTTTTTNGEGFDGKPNTSSTTTSTSADPWFDPVLGRVRNSQGRVIDGILGDTVKNVYTSGWASNGAKGVLATTMYDAYDIADRLISDHIQDQTDIDTAHVSDASGLSPMNAAPDSLTSVPEHVQEVLDGRVAGRRVITWDVWKWIEAEEMRRGAAKGKANERMSWQDVDSFLSSTLP
ncbi:NADPH-adrenodoxin reductase [Tulasnella sp. JGI-2019a]|nr:NADPH-adrenodoxin reductase [Tulasnella sp. JGI-2019a]